MLKELAITFCCLILIVIFVSKALKAKERSSIILNSIVFTLYVVLLAISLSNLIRIIQQRNQNESSIENNILTI